MFANFLSDMKVRICSARNRRRTLQQVERDALQHATTVHKRSLNFYGREELQEALRVRVLHPGGTAVVVHGDSGSGKTSLMCKLGVTLRQSLPAGASVVVRLCGTTPLSSSVCELLWGVCTQLAKARAGHAQSKKEELPAVPSTTDFEGLVECFAAMLATASEVAPIAVLLDSLDQLTDRDRGRSQPHKWLPLTGLNPHVHLLLSSLSTEYVYARPSCGHSA